MFLGYISCPSNAVLGIEHCICIVEFILWLLGIKSGGLLMGASVGFDGELVIEFFS